MHAGPFYVESLILPMRVKRFAPVSIKKARKKYSRGNDAVQIYPLVVVWKVAAHRTPGRRAPECLRPSAMRIPMPPPLPDDPRHAISGVDGSGARGEASIWSFR